MPGTSETPAPPASEPPALLRAPAAAAFCSLSTASWYRHDAAGRVPAPVRIGGCVAWRRAELLSWINAGCPPRAEWEARDATARNGKSASRT